MDERVRSCPLAIFREGGNKANQGVRARHECQEETPFRLTFIFASDDREGAFSRHHPFKIVPAKAP